MSRKSAAPSRELTRSSSPARIWRVPVEYGAKDTLLQSVVLNEEFAKAGAPIAPTFWRHLGRRDPAVGTTEKKRELSRHPQARSPGV